MRRAREPLKPRRSSPKKHGRKIREQAKECVCNSCGHVTWILRPTHVHRRPGHQKHLWCPECLAYVSHTET